jgi:Flp pilus assembly protein TadD
LSSPPSREVLVTLAVAAAVFWIAFDEGSFGLQSRAMLAIAVWWAVVVVLAARVCPVSPLPRATIVGGGMLSALAAWTLASVAWTDSSEKAFTEFNRVSLYVGVYWLVAIAAPRRVLGRFCDGMAIGLTGIGVLALGGRLFPSIFPEGDVAELLPAAAARLSWPVGYWNGLAILLALAFPLLLRSAVSGSSQLERAASLFPLPALGGAIYLTSSRGGVAAAALAVALFLMLTARRWAAVGVTALVGVGTVSVLAVLSTRDELVNGPVDSDLAASQGRSAAILIFVICVATSVALVTAERWLGGRLRLPPAAGWAFVGAGLLAVVVSVAAVDPADRLREFREQPDSAQLDDPEFIETHLASASGTGRWQYWTAAVEEFESAPFLGDGAGSYEAWWTQHGSISMFVRDAHSLYFEALGELGIVGFLLVVGAVGTGLVAAARRVFRARGEQTTLAALAAAFLAYAFGAGVDWMWELTAVSVVGVACLGLLTGPATVPLSRPELRALEARPPDRPRVPAAARWGAVALAVLLVGGQAIPLLAHLALEDSRAAVGRGDGDEALAAARSARALQPWAASPYVQLALVKEHIGDLAAARRWILKALERDSRDWRLWLLATRIETKAGRIEEARQSLARAVELNPRSPLFADVARP